MTKRVGLALVSLIFGGILLIIDFTKIGIGIFSVSYTLSNSMNYFALMFGVFGVIFAEYLYDTNDVRRIGYVRGLTIALNVMWLIIAIMVFAYYSGGLTLLFPPLLLDLVDSDNLNSLYWKIWIGISGIMAGGLSYHIVVGRREVQN